MSKTCYQCDRTTRYLFHDGRCSDCTRLTPEEVVGKVKEEDEEQEYLRENFP